MNVSIAAMNLTSSMAMTIGQMWLDVTGGLTPKSSNLADDDSYPMDPFQYGFGNRNHSIFVFFLTMAILFCVCWFCSSGVAKGYAEGRPNADPDMQSGYSVMSCGSWSLMTGCILLAIFASLCGLIGSNSFIGATKVTTVDMTFKYNFMQCESPWTLDRCYRLVASPIVIVEFGGKDPEKTCRAKVDYKACSIPVQCTGPQCDLDTALAQSKQCIGNEIRFREAPWMDGVHQSIIVNGNCDTCTARLELPISENVIHKVKVSGITMSSVGLFAFLFAICALACLSC